MAVASRNIKRNLANTFGAVGYLFCLLQWFWAVLLYFSFIQSAISFTLLPNESQPVAAPHPTMTLPSQLEIAILIIMTVVIVVTTIYVLVKMPATIARTGSKIVHQTTNTIAPVIIKAQHKKDTQKNRTKLEPKLMAAVKAGLILIPILLGLSSGLIKELPIEYSIAIIISIGLGGVSMSFFLFQYVTARFLRVKVSDLW
ncbi:hypothetical protein PV379_00400 [Streptomyces caniscabiei]|uniref:hypothetical protein n=1 Tax=Streptomyces caniscabiei TaxID=2746961 RepID=UPI0029B5D69A|nr:hypothetical protein [Streptomyces caniscabiei]MDX2775816.1 hypothetical protein [Streptomyces caniscabiei]